MKAIKLFLFIIIFLFNISIISAWACFDCGSCGTGCDGAYVSIYDAWPGLYHVGSGNYDGLIWGGQYGDVGLYGEDYSSMVTCYDWEDDNSMDDCFGASNQDLLDCRDASSVLDNWCDTTVTCYGANANADHELDTGSDGDKWGPQYVVIQYYHSCSDPDYDWYRVRFPYYVLYQHKYDCDSTPETDYEGNYNSWLNVKSNIGLCTGLEECDENHDDDISTTYNEVIDSPCRTKNENSCSVVDDCLSDNCASGTCKPATETSCTDSTDNDGDGKIDCDDSDCEGETGPGGKICCNDGAYNCGTCKYCSSDLCESRALGYVCNSNLYCSDYPGGDNSYNTGSTRKIPSQGKCDSSQNCDYSSTSPVCDYAEGVSQEGTGDTICQDGPSTCSDTCSDSIDNDANGCTDSNDYQCGGTESDCENSVDDDCDGDTDEADDDCATEIADLEILEIIPIQVVPYVDMVKDKSGYVKVVAVNNGPITPVDGTVSVKFNGNSLSSETPTRPMTLDKNVSFYFNFTPNVTGTDLVINATIEVS
ncbi:hypothetical protein HQ533_00915 [Candidatus Woesearchaeota archaeon]|nr:hypothetical protein [Candidatus Woesearchaeota archaeon]